MKKILSLVLTLAILCTMCVFTGVTASAADEQWNGKAATEFAGGGTGAANDPYKIGTAAELKLFANIVNGNEELPTGFSQKTDACAELTADIVLNTGTFTVDSNGNPLYNDAAVDETTINAWFPIGYYITTPTIKFSQYSGTFNGNNHTVSGLYFNNTSQISVGLFGWTDPGAKISNLGVVNSYIKCSGHVGGVCGYNGGTITGCYNTGMVNGTGDKTGGVCGYNAGTITGCYNTGMISGSDWVGGVCAGCNGTITGCYNTGTVSGSRYVGGVCGESNGAITGCYNTGAISGSNWVGGIVGHTSNNTIIGCYNTGAVRGTGIVGGVCGYKYSGTITNCYYLKDSATGGINGADVSGSAEMRTASDMKSQAFVNLLNKSAGVSFVFYGGYPAQSYEVDPRLYHTNVTYEVESIYFVDIPGEVTLGGTVEVKAEGVILDEGKQLNIALTGTSGEGNAFTVKNDKTATLAYNVTNGGADGTGDTTVDVDDVVLTVNPTIGPSGSTTLKFSTPTTTITYSGEYSGTVTFTVSVGNRHLS